jgi:integrase/recombinase XerD
MAQVPVVTIFARHAEDCPHRDDEMWKKCRCRKHLRWTASGKQYRKSARTRAWATAEKERQRVVNEFEAGIKAENINAATDGAITVGAAAASFVAMKKGQGVSTELVQKHERELERLDGYLQSKGVYVVANITLDLLIAFRATWDTLYSSPTTRQKVQERLRGFLRYCHNAGHLQRLPILSAIKGKDSPTVPLTAKEYISLLKAVSKAFTDPRKIIRVSAFIQLMRHTGLAITDAATLEQEHLQFNNRRKTYLVTRKRQKTGTDVSVPITSDLAEFLQVVPNKNQRYVFWDTGAGSKRNAKKKWDEDLRTVFRKAGLEHGHSHQLRDTFAVDLLAKGVRLEDVSKLLGHDSVKTTEKYYAKWVPEREDRLHRVVMESWGVETEADA